MPNFDLNITGSLIIALCAVISPIFTSIINNRYLLKIKKLELQQQHYEDTILYKRSILENYLRYLSQCSKCDKRETRMQYSEYYSLAYCYVPNNVQKMMSELDKKFEYCPVDITTKDLDSITEAISNLLQDM